MIEGNKYRLGIFVISGFIILIGLLLMMGASELFKKKVRIITLTRDSVQGLEVGAAVKYKGVQIGRIDDINIRGRDNLIRIEMIVDPDSFMDIQTKTDLFGNSIEGFYTFVKDEVKKGMRCQLEYAGITGLKYVDLGYFKTPEDEISQLPLPDGRPFVYVPSHPSMLKDIVQTINKTVDRIGHIDIDTIAGDFAATLKSARTLLEDPELKNSIKRLQKISENLEKTSQSIRSALSEKRIESIVTEFNSALVEINKLVKELSTDIKGAQVVKTARSFRNAARSIDQTHRAIVGTLMKLDCTINAATEMLETINEDPATFLHGRRAPRIIKK